MPSPSPTAPSGSVSGAGGYSYSPNGTGGVNYYQNGSPVTREAFASATGANVGDYENFAAQQYASNPIQGASGTSQRSIGSVLPDSTGPTAQPTAADLAATTLARNQAAARASAGIQHQGVTDLADQGISSEGSTVGSKIQDLIDSLRVGQNSINTDSKNNELAKMQGHQGILDMVGNGIRSGGVMLANKNAGDSSAAEALAQAYGLLGQQQESKVGNQYEQGNNKIATEQSNQDLQAEQGSRHITEDKASAINGIVNTAHNSLMALNAYMATASLPDRIDAQKEADAIRQKAVSDLMEYDTKLSQGVAGIKPTDAATNRANAATDAAKGVASPDQFNYTTQAPLTQQNTGPAASSLPIYVNPSSKKATA